MSKYNVGDKVRIISERGTCWNFDGKMDKWCGKIMTIRATGRCGIDGFYSMEEDKHENEGAGWCWSDSDIVGLVKDKTPNEKIVITHDGKTTTATLYREDGSKVTATARCAPEDTFDFNVGAKLAMERLTEKIDDTSNYEWRVVNRKPKVGDYIRLKCCDYEFDHIGDILKAEAVTPSGLVRICEKNHPNVKNKTLPDFEWNYTPSEYEVVEAYTAPKYYNGKVVCVSNSGDEDFTVGKIYKIKDGKFIDNHGHIRPNDGRNSRVTKPSDLDDGYFKTWYYRFIPLVEDENKPLTIEELKKMDGKKVYAIRLDEDGRETPDHSFSGWHTVHVERGVLTDENDKYYFITSNGKAYGYNAYRTKPTK